MYFGCTWHVTGALVSYPYTFSLMWSDFLGWTRILVAWFTWKHSQTLDYLTASRLHGNPVVTHQECKHDQGNKLAGVGLQSKKSETLSVINLYSTILRGGTIQWLSHLFIVHLPVFTVNCLQLIICTRWEMEGGEVGFSACQAALKASASHPGKLGEHTTPHQRSQHTTLAHLRLHACRHHRPLTLSLCSFISRLEAFHAHLGDLVSARVKPSHFTGPSRLRNASV